MHITALLSSSYGKQYTFVFLLYRPYWIEAMLTMFSELSDIFIHTYIHTPAVKYSVFLCVLE